ncbi:MAG TPA: histidine kinase [Agromyces sp.]
MTRTRMTGAGTSAARRTFTGSTGRFFAWIAAHTGLWMALVWIPILLFAPIADVVDMIATGSEPAWRIALAGAFIAGAAASFAVAVIVGDRRREAPLAVAALVLLAGIACAGMGAFEWATPFALPAIACAVVLRRSEVLWTLIFMTLFAGVLTWFVTGELTAGLGTTALVFLSGLGNFVVHQLVAVIAELEATREELARAAVVHERLRFSRDLHDLLGHTLSVVIVKAEAVRRLVRDDPDAAAGHAADIETIGRQALADVRAAVSGYREAGLAAETERARLGLAASGHSVDVRNDAGVLPTAIEELFGWVVREGATNIMRHSTARHCRITVALDGGEAVIEVADDGRPGAAGSTDAADSTDAAAPAASATDGSGLAGLRERLADAGGELHAAHAADGFHLIARVPLPGPREDGR